ncbi:MAG: pseudouridine synthase [Planctomycetota bacterium]
MARAPKQTQEPIESGADLAPDAGETHLVRLNKYLADSGVASRRKCDELIAGGKVSVDGETVTALGTRVDPAQNAVEIDGFVLKPSALKRRYYLLNKPPGVVCTNEARETRPRAIDLITDPRKGRIYTIGRLDEESKGLILLTNDGDFAHQVMHPRHGIEKTYVVKVQGKIDDEALNKIRDGVHLSEGRTSGARILVERRKSDVSVLSITLREGMNREIRRVFARFGYKVVELKRVRIGGLTERGIKVGRWRELTPPEVRAVLEHCNEEAPSDDGHRSPRRGAGRGARDSHRAPPAGRRSGPRESAYEKPRDTWQGGAQAESRPRSRTGPRPERARGDARPARGESRDRFDGAAPARRGERNRAPADDGLFVRNRGAHEAASAGAPRGIRRDVRGRGDARAERAPRRPDTQRNPRANERGTRGAARDGGRGARAQRDTPPRGGKGAARRPLREPRGRSNRT